MRTRLPSSQTLLSRINSVEKNTVKVPKREEEDCLHKFSSMSTILGLFDESLKLDSPVGKV